jgi:LacI family transcriptional regulator
MNIRTIAKLCGVSISTVSRILNNKPDVNPETREKVISMMNEIGFRPTIVAGRHESIGVVMPAISNTEFIGELINGITSAAFPLGCNLTLIPYDAVSDAADLTHYCRSNGLCGMLVINPALNSRLPHMLLKHSIPHVIVAATYRDSDISWVDVDNVGGAKEAMRHLMELGHKRIVLFSRTPEYLCDQQRIDGYREALEEFGLEADPKLRFELVGRRMDQADALLSILRSPNPPTGIFCTTYRQTLTVINTLQRSGFRVPDDVSVVGFGDYDGSAIMNPPMTTVFQPVFEMGKKAVEAFEELNRQEKISKRQILLPIRLMVRNSTRRLE